MKVWHPDIPVPLTQEDKLDLFWLARTKMQMQVAIIAVVAAFFLLALAEAIGMFFRVR